MTDLIITDVDERLMRAIELRAEATHSTPDEAARELLRLGLLLDVEGRAADADRIRAMTPRTVTEDSTEIIRRLRDRG